LAGERIRYELHVPKRPDWAHDRYFEVAYEPPIDDGPNACMVVVIMDSSERRQAEAEVKESQRRLEKAQEIRSSPCSGNGWHDAEPGKCLRSRPILRIRRAPI
jgi:hypothetical protein